jgi:hypothetical protein
MIAELVLSVVELKGHGLRPCRKSLRTIDGAAVSRALSKQCPITELASVRLHVSRNCQVDFRRRIGESQ